MTARVVAHISPEGVRLWVRFGPVRVRVRFGSPNRRGKLPDLRGKHLTRDGYWLPDDAEVADWNRWTRITAELWEPDPAA